jgi:hypothetical protein
MSDKIGTTNIIMYEQSALFSPRFCFTKRPRQIEAATAQYHLVDTISEQQAFD